MYIIPKLTVKFQMSKKECQGLLKMNNMSKLKELVGNFKDNGFKVYMNKGKAHS